MVVGCFRCNRIAWLWSVLGVVVECRSCGCAMWYLWLCCVFVYGRCGYGVWLWCMVVVVLVCGCSVR